MNVRTSTFKNFFKQENVDKRFSVSNLICMP
jgi:hypothetical protein